MLAIVFLLQFSTAIKKAIQKGIETDLEDHRNANEVVGQGDETVYVTDEYVAELQTEMMTAAEQLDFERAAILRDRITKLSDAIGEPLSSVEMTPSKGKKGRKKGRRRRGSKVPRPRKPE